MLEPRRIPDLDRWLDELDELVETGAPSSRFYRQALGQLRVLLAADGAAVILPGKSGWEVFAGDGKLETKSIRSSEFNSKPVPSSRAAQTAGWQAESPLDTPRSPDGSRRSSSTPEPLFSNAIAVPIRKAAPHKGLLVAFFDHELPVAAESAARELMVGVAEAVAAHQRSMIEKFLDDDWQRLQTCLTSLRRSESISEAAFVLVNELRPLFRASRVSFVDEKLVVAVSGVDQIDPTSPLVSAMKQVVLLGNGNHLNLGPDSQKRDDAKERDIGESTGRESHLAPADDLSTGIASNHSILPLTHSAWLLIEWLNQDQALEAKPLVQQFSTTISETWSQQSRWLKLPRLMRRLAIRAIERGPTNRFRRCLTAVAVATGLTILLLSPWSFRLHATGRLQPVEQRSVFASADGFIEEILVDDGEKVIGAQPLLRVRSHLLEREAERIRGELAALREKQSGINIAINEAAAEETGRSSAALSQSKLTTELRVLEVEEKGLNEQLALLDSEREKLIVCAPIAGTVVAHDLRKYLDRRPVKRGDLLFRIADLEGPWQLELEIADRDSAYVEEHFVGQSEPPPIDYTLAADPKVRHEANLTWLAPVAYRNPETGVVVEAHAAIDVDKLDKRHMGAKVDATFPCGKQPIWFIWSRPLVEELQRRFWW